MILSMLLPSSQEMVNFYRKVNIQKYNRHESETGEDMLTFLLIIEDVKTRNKLEHLYIMYHKGLYIIAYRILNNTHDAQDAAQTSIIKLAKYLDRIEDLDCNKTKNLIVAIVRNTAIDIYRRKKQHPLSQLDAMSDLLHDNQPLPDDLILRMSEAKNMAEKLAKLHADYAEILTLKYYYEFNDIEISELLCISHQNARTRLHRAKKALLKLLNECNEEERNVSI